jgi:hypothetical protein
MPVSFSSAGRSLWPFPSLGRPEGRFTQQHQENEPKPRQKNLDIAEHGISSSSISFFA